MSLLLIRDKVITDEYFVKSKVHNGELYNPYGCKKYKNYKFSLIKICKRWELGNFLSRIFKNSEVDSKVFSR